PGGGRPEPEHCLAATDVSDDSRVHGLIAFFFACYGAGTPALDSFGVTPGQQPLRLAPEPLVAALPRRLLAHPGGGALAVFGHVDRAWTPSIRPPDVPTQLQPFRNLIGRVLRGEPVGVALDDFRDRYVSRSLALLPEPDQPPLRGRELARAWLERNDARNFVLLGDPAVRLRPECLRNADVP